MPGGAPPAAAQLPTREAKQDVRKKVNKYAFHDGSGTGQSGNGAPPPPGGGPGGAPMNAPTLYAAPSSGPMGAAPAQPANPAPQPTSLNHLQDPRLAQGKQQQQGFQQQPAPVPAPSPMPSYTPSRSSAPDFGQNSAPAKTANRIDPNKIPSVPFAIYRCLWFPDRLSDRLLVITGGLRLDSLRTCSSTRLKFHTRTMPPQSLTPRATTR